MTKDETGLWLLVWQGKEPSVSNEVFQVIAFAASTGACVCNTPLNFDATNKMMSGFLEKFQDSGGYGGTHDYLGDLAIKRQDDKLFIFGDMHLVGTLLTTNANQAIHGTYRKLDDPGR